MGPLAPRPLAEEGELPQAQADLEVLASLAPASSSHRRWEQCQCQWDPPKPEGAPVASAQSPSRAADRQWLSSRTPLVLVVLAVPALTSQWVVESDSARLGLPESRSESELHDAGWTGAVHDKSEGLGLPVGGGPLRELDLLLRQLPRRSRLGHSEFAVLWPSLQLPVWNLSRHRSRSPAPLPSPAPALAVTRTQPDWKHSPSPRWILVREPRLEATTWGPRLQLLGHNKGQLPARRESELPVEKIVVASLQRVCCDDCSCLFSAVPCEDRFWFS